MKRHRLDDSFPVVWWVGFIERAKQRGHCNTVLAWQGNGADHSCRFLRTCQQNTLHYAQQGTRTLPINAAGNSRFISRKFTPQRALTLSPDYPRCCERQMAIKVLFRELNTNNSSTIENVVAIIEEANGSSTSGDVVCCPSDAIF